MKNGATEVEKVDTNVFLENFACRLYMNIFARKF